MNTSARMVVVSGLLLTGTGAPGATPAAHNGLPAGFIITAHGVHRSGDVGGGGSVMVPLSPTGEASALRAYAAVPQSCVVKLTRDVQSAQPPAAMTWTFDARLVSHDQDGATVDLASRRVASDPTLSSQPTAVVRQRRLTLFEGQPIVLDYVALEHDSASDCDGYLIQAAMHFVDPAETADTRLTYDLWLVHTDQRGRQDAVRTTTQAGQGEPADYGFAPMWFDANGEPDRDGPVGIAVSGKVRGRLLPNGSVYLSLGAVRFVRDRSGSGMAEAGGKSMTVPVGETIEVQLPQISVSAGATNLGTAFQGQGFAVRLTPRKVP